MVPLANKQINNRNRLISKPPTELLLIFASRLVQDRGVQLNGPYGGLDAAKLGNFQSLVWFNQISVLLRGLLPPSIRPETPFALVISMIVP